MNIPMPEGYFVIKLSELGLSKSDYEMHKRRGSAYVLRQYVERDFSRARTMGFFATKSEAEAEAVRIEDGKDFEIAASVRAWEKSHENDDET